MTAIPTIHSWVNLEQPDFRDMNTNLSDVLNFVMNPPMVRLRKVTNQAIANNVSTAIIWDFVEVENYEFWDAAAPTKITPSVPGWYVGSCGFSFSQNITGEREMNVQKNNSGTDKILRINNTPYTNSSLTVCNRGNVFLEQFNGTTDFMTVEVSQTSGASLNILSDTPERQPDVVLRWFAPL
jgi:hypothetical protein